MVSTASEKIVVLVEHQFNQGLVQVGNAYPKGGLAFGD